MTACDRYVVILFRPLLPCVLLAAVVAGCSSSQGGQAQSEQAATQVVTVVAVDKLGNPAPGYEVEASDGFVESCYASPAGGEGLASCSPTAAGADVCWVDSDRVTLLCGTDPWEKKLVRMTSDEEIGTLTPKPTPDPWGLVLADGARCRLRNGGSWGGRADGWVGAYSCDRGEGEYVLVDQNAPDTVVDRSGPVWHVRIGALGGADEQFPAPTPIAVTTAYFAGTP